MSLVQRLIPRYEPAALKRIEVGAYNPPEVKKTNIGGTVDVHRRDAVLRVVV
ncbi:hypothetical protein [Bradyrhizobium erythrophlei]|uniref:hypothetical protein n=1 Tax=Bradyrhizobium erythrophlei TaxID=1437360 RepID=UPI0012EBEFF1|nr:hypothetical protein [Bradyrhizobium erythrophlei]